MMQQLMGMPVVNAIIAQITGQIEKLNEKQIIPKLAVVRLGEMEDDIAYERGILKRFSAVNAAVEVIALPRDATRAVLDETVIKLNGDNSIHGILIFRPLPKHLPEESLKELIDQKKDVDGMGTLNSAFIYEGKKEGYAPCTAQAVLELLDFYNIAPEGKKITIVGRSLTVGKPLSMLLLAKNATVTICHTKTVDLAAECRRADILVACAGAAKMIKANFTHPGQVVIDVGINMLDGKLCGDVDYVAVADSVAAITPVPGGVGTVTTSVLLKNTVTSAMRALN
jgi:methylenetetrahydrofolate dehydrogenase (NADP+)/methenyltetrahydrofolate cyclohydrolase